MFSTPPGSGSDDAGGLELRATPHRARGVPCYAKAPEDMGRARWAVRGPPCEAATGEETSAEGEAVEAGSRFVDVAARRIYSYKYINVHGDAARRGGR